MIGRLSPRIVCSVEPEGSPKVRVETSGRVLTLEYEDCENKADKAVLTVDNHDLSNFDDPVWRKGNVLEVSWGYPEAMAPTRRCLIRKVTGFKTLKVEAHGLEVLLQRVKKSRVFNDVKRSDVARLIAEEFGFREEKLLHIEDTEVVLDHLTQAATTDALFLRRLAHAEGFEWYIDFDGFHFHQRDVTQRPLKRLVYVEDPEQGEILGINVENDVTAKPGTVAARVRDPVKRRSIDVLASLDTEADRGVLGAVVEAPGTDGTAVPGFQKVAQDDLMSRPARSDAEAKRVAAARFRRAQQVAVKMKVETVGDPNQLAKSVVELAGVGKRLSQRYYVRTVKHVVGRGYRCTLDVVSDGSGGHSTKSRIATEASAIQVGPGLKGRRGPAGPQKRRSIDIDPKVLQATLGVDADGAPVQSFGSGRES